MTPATQGRHCAACNKVVVDFTGMSDAELLAFLQRQPSGCGRFRADQLQPACRRRYMGWLLWPPILVTISSQLLNVTPVVAQTTVKVPSPKKLKSQRLMGQEATHPNTPPTIRGKVVDSLQAPLAGVVVLLDGTTIGASTDTLGQFELIVPSYYQHHNKGLLLFSQIGYYTQAVSLNSFSQPHAVIVMRIDRVTKHEQIIVGGYCAFPRWYKPRGIWWRVTQLFRR